MPFDLSEEAVVAAENALGARLPESYRVSMKIANGGERTAIHDCWFLIPILDKSNRKRLARTCNDIVRETEQQSSWPGWPEDAVKIADNGAGDALFFKIDGDKCLDAVFHWNHETGEINNISGSFAEIET